MSLFFSSSSHPKIRNIDESLRKQSIELLNQFFKQINSYPLDGIFKVKPRAATQMVDSFLKLSGSGKVLFIGVVLDSELTSMLIARIEERPFLLEEKILYVDIAVTKNGHLKKGYMKSLLGYAEEWAQKKDIPILELRTLTANQDAIRFWNKQNYKEFYIRFRKTI
jgi:GNAT superfamily N-acetyltransferase